MNLNGGRQRIADDRRVTDLIVLGTLAGWVAHVVGSEPMPVAKCGTTREVSLGGVNRFVTVQTWHEKGRA
jgi:hypothetical protein